MRYEAVDVKCPFYKDETKNSIKCEGIVSVACINNFDNAREKKKHKAKYCCDQYNSCPLNKSIMLKY